MIDVVWLAETGPCSKFANGQRIPCPGGVDAASRAMYILLTGRVDVFKQSAAGGTQSAGSLLPGDVFGGREYFFNDDDYVYTAGVESVVYVINEDSFNDLSWSRPDMLFEVIKAAYMPLRKLTASQKTALNVSSAEQGSLLKGGSSRKAASAKDMAAGGANKFANDAADSGIAASALVLSTRGADSMTGIFPEGHKGYPGVTHPEFKSLIFPKDYECPYCKHTFSDFRVFRSKLYESAPMRFDLRKFFTDFMTEWYDVVVCRHCMFSTFYTYFTEPKPMKKEKIESALIDVRQQILLDFDGERDIDTVFASHYLAMICSDSYTTVGNQIRAKLWGNLSWLYEDVEDKEMEKFAAGKAAEAYEAVYTGSRLNPTQEQAACLSIAGMQYRAGIDDNLRKYLFAAKTMQMGDKTYSKLAEDFMYDLRIEE